MVENDLVRLAGGFLAVCTGGGGAAVLDWARPLLIPRVDDVTLWPWLRFIDWLSSDGLDVAFRKFSLSRGRDVTTFFPPVDDVIRLGRDRALVSSDSRLLFFGAVATTALLATGFEPPFTSLVILDVKDAENEVLLLLLVTGWLRLSFTSVLSTQRLARLEAVAFISELRREVETDLDAEDSLASAFFVSVLARLAFALLTSLLRTGHSVTDALSLTTALWSWTVDFLDGRGISDWRLVGLLVMLVSLRRGSFCSVETEADLWSNNGLLGTPADPCSFVVLLFVACSQSSDSDFEVVLMEEDDATSTCCTSPFCVCNSFSVAGGRWRSRSVSRRAVIGLQSKDAADKWSTRGFVAGSGASYETIICPPSSVSNTTVARCRLGDCTLADLL